MARVIVGMSGGVDSAVTAYLLKAAGHDAVGVTLRTWVGSDGRESRCCEIEDARRTAWALEMPYYVQNCVAAFRERVIQPFADDYIRGRTPNPCVGCNRDIKWALLLEAAARMGAAYVATGHYASVVRRENGRYTVREALSAQRDQTYMLYRLTQDQLRHTLMPLGGLSKDEVRSIAARAGLPVAQKRDSQEICFVTEGSYADVLEEYARAPIPEPGDFVDENGRILGRHRGITHYTVGQRRGLGVALGKPAYVTRIDAEHNTVVLGGEASLYSGGLVCDDLNWMGMAPPPAGETFRAIVKIRYRHPGTAAAVRAADDGTAQIRFDEPVRAAAPGQSAVFYDDGGCVLGGGVIRDVCGASNT